MIREGKYIENEFNLERPFVKWYYLLNFELIIAEYNCIEDSNSFVTDVKEAMHHFFESFYFFYFEEILVEGRLFKEYTDLKINNDLSKVDKIIDSYDSSYLQFIFNMGGTEIFEFSVGMNYKNIIGETSKMDSNWLFSIGINNRNENNQLYLSFLWEFGAEWFYNKYKEENRAIVRKATIDFYESNPNYKELKIDYQLRGFDLEIEKYTQKEVIVKKNLG